MPARAKVIVNPTMLMDPNTGEPIGGGVGASASFTPAAAAYSAADVIDVAKEFAGLGLSGSLIRILSASLKIDATALISGETSYTLHLYTVTPPSEQADNAAWALASADLPSYVGSIDLGTPVDLGAACYVAAANLNKDVLLAGTSLFGRLVTAGGATFAAVARQVTLHVARL